MQIIKHKDGNIHNHEVKNLREAEFRSVALVCNVCGFKATMHVESEAPFHENFPTKIELQQCIYHSAFKDGCVISTKVPWPSDSY